MFALIGQLFDTSDFRPRWLCGRWSPEHGWLHILSDTAIFGAYFAIPIVLVYYITRRKDTPFPPMVWLFAAFILACGIGHLIEASLFWYPWYRLSGVVKFLTAVVSWATVIALIFITPKALALPGLLNEMKQRQRLEQAMHEQAQQFHALVLASAQIVWRTNAAGETEEDSESWRAFTGQTSAQWRGWGWLDALHPDDRDRIKNEWRDAIATQRPYQLEYRVRHTSGDWRWMAVHAVPLLTNGVVTGWIGMNTDITNRKQAELCTAKISERVRQIVESALDAIITMDEQGIVTGWNPQAEAVFGWKQNDALRRPLAELIVPPEHHDSFREGMQRFMAPGQQATVNKHFELTALRKDGTPFPVEMSVSAFRLGEHHEFCGFVRDITERRALVRFQGLLDSAPEAMVIVNSDGQIVLVNVQTERLFGYAREQLLGQQVEMLIPERYRMQHPEHRRVFFTNPRSRPMGANLDLYGLRADGSEFPLELSLSPLQTADGILASSAIRDTTERKRVEEQVRSSLREKEILLKEIHHRVKNNLAVIGSLFYLQSTYTQNEDVLHILQECQDRVRSMALVHEQLYRSGELAGVDFSVYTKELTHQLYRNYALNHDQIKLNFDLASITFDVDRAIPLGLILNELIANALRHAFPDGNRGTITVELQRLAPNGMVLLVRDTGIGLPDETTLATRHSLGMRLVHALAKQIDATIEFVRLTPGTEVRVTIEDLAAHVT